MWLSNLPTKLFQHLPGVPSSSTWVTRVLVGCGASGRGSRSPDQHKPNQTIIPRRSATLPIKIPQRESMHKMSSVPSPQTSSLKAIWKMQRRRWQILEAMSNPPARQRRLGGRSQRPRPPRALPPCLLGSGNHSRGRTWRPRKFFSLQRWGSAGDQ